MSPTSEEIGFDIGALVWTFCFGYSLGSNRPYLWLAVPMFVFNTAMAWGIRNGVQSLAGLHWAGNLNTLLSAGGPMVFWVFMRWKKSKGEATA